MFLICSSLYIPSLFAADSDTTYGHIRIKKRATSSSGSESGNSSDEAFFASCMKSCISGVFDGCLDVIFNHRGETTITYDGNQTDDSRPQKKRTTSAQAINFCSYSSSPFHFSGGASLGSVIYSKGIAAGFILGGTTAFTWFPDTFFGLRVVIEPTAAFDNILVDMEKDVFVDGLQVGITTFSGEHGKEFILPLTAQLLIVPPIPSRAMFLSLGGGPCYKQEITWGKRTLNGNISDSKITFNQWCPAFHIGLGFYLPFDRLVGVFEFSYSVMLNESSHRFETPGDNSRYGHMPAISFSISTP